MYGLVNRAIAELVCEQFGEEVWERITDRAGVDDDEFVAMDAYDDAVTYSLVEAASIELKLPANAILEAFGEHWTTYTGRHGYGKIFDVPGEDMRAFLRNLNRFHDGMRTNFPELRPPFIGVEDVDEDTCHVRYRSQRAGLAPMIVGLLRGLAKIKNETVEIEHVSTLQDDGTEALFKVRFFKVPVASG